MVPALKPDPGRARRMKRAALIGAFAALLCQALPPNHRVLCAAVVKFASLTCGVPGGI